MRKLIVYFFVCMLLCVTVSSVTGTVNDEYDANFYEGIEKNSQSKRAQWDIIFEYDVEAPTGEQSITGCEFDGTHFLVSEWGYSGATQPRVVSILDRDGNLVDQWTPSWLSGGSGGLRDLAYDGEYFYGGNTGNTIYCFDIDGSLITSWASPAAVRSIAYDGDHDAFWINNWEEDLQLVDRSGSTLYSISSPPSMYGSAWEKQCTGTPALWIFTGTSEGGPCQVEKIVDIYSGGTNLGIQHQVSDDFDPTGIAGGLFFTELYDPGNGTLGGIIQMSPDMLFGYELCEVSMPPDIPEAPIGPNSGVTGIEYTFEANTTDPEGDDIYYWFDWGDGENSGWVGPYNSGEPGSAGHVWTTSGDFLVTVKARDVNYAESGFSPATPITIVLAPTIEISMIQGGFLKVKTKIKNIGDLDATNVQWNISLDGGTWINKVTSGTEATLASGEEIDIISNTLFGWGATEVTVTATIAESTFTRSQNGFIYLIYAKVNMGG
ncbi:hypothetical protein AYK21_02995 [Thermoplasmatales archaeon SG8-52-2]|nr:MAG: hypothetical protein AYK21_02995 [Thermoplasmatales archaeon SG8-52-2]